MPSPIKQQQLKKFGEFLIENLRKSAISYFDRTMEKTDTAASLKEESQTELKTLTPAQKTFFKECFLHSLDGGIHDFLFALGVRNDDEHDIQIMVDGLNIADISDGLQGDFYDWKEANK